jgi:hypothetical protein
MKLIAYFTSCLLWAAPYQIKMPCYHVAPLHLIIFTVQFGVFSRVAPTAMIDKVSRMALTATIDKGTTTTDEMVDVMMAAMDVTVSLVCLLVGEVGRSLPFCLLFVFLDCL